VLTPIIWEKGYSMIDIEIDGGIIKIGYSNWSDIHLKNLPI
jgi:hypothetical protein